MNQVIEFYLVMGAESFTSLMADIRQDIKVPYSDGSGPKPGPGPCFLEGPEPDFWRRAQARAGPQPDFWGRARKFEL